MQKVRTRLLLRSPFFGTLVMTTPLVETRDVPTAATDMKRIYWNPDFFASLTIDEAIFVLMHEIMHIIHLHGLRRGTRNPELWNVACDYAINHSLKTNGMTMPKMGLLDEQYAGMSADAIYEMLKKQGGSGGKSPLEGDLLPAPLGDEAAKIATEVRGRVAQAVTAGRLAGNMPADLEREINALLHPQLPWRELLRHYMTARVRDRQDWGKRNKRFSSVILPTRSGRRMDKIGCIIDTSGSISREIMDTLGNEVQAISADVGAKVIHVKFADTRTAHEQRFHDGEPMVLAPRGGGGTDMRVPLAEFAAEPPNVCVLLTDGYTPWPAAEPDFPLIVCCTTDVVAPVGVTVRIND
jgi:predicted metal-dependent peptidase